MQIKKFVGENITQTMALVKKEINKQLNATVDFKDVKLSLLRHFPKATISIKGLTVVGKGEFAKDTLIAAAKLEATAGIFSVLKGKDIKVYGLYAYQPRIHLLMNAFGRANWDIAKPSTSETTDKADTSASSFKMQLKKNRGCCRLLNLAMVKLSKHFKMQPINFQVLLSWVGKSIFILLSTLGILIFTQNTY